MNNPIKLLSNRSGLLIGANTSVLISSAFFIVLFIVLTILIPERTGYFYNYLKNGINNYFSWYYILLVNIYLVLSIYLAFSKYGKIILGGAQEKPRYSFFSWFSMLFGAGIGIGILFYSIAEPVLHYQSNPFIDFTEDRNAAMQFGFRATIFHWGLHGWGIFVIIGLFLAYFNYKKGLPLALRSALYPLIEDKIYGPIGHIADSLGIIGTVFGISTSLGLGANQINAGLNYLAGFEVNLNNQLIIIFVVSLFAIGSVLLGLDKGIKRLSNLNMVMTLILLVIFLAAGPTIYILKQTGINLTDYFVNTLQLGAWINSNPADTWQADWTMFYWGWWLSWAPFVGVFIARISKGRTIKEFCIGVLLAPTIMSAIWISILGSTAFYLEFIDGMNIIESVNNDMTTALFITIESLGLSNSVSFAIATLCIVMLLTYFVTSSDSATLVVCSLVCIGEESPRARYRVFWGFAICGSAIALLLAGGLKTLQTASVLSAFPSSIIMIIATAGFLITLKKDLQETNDLEEKQIKAKRKV
ncbi:BCCT family transporter [Photobacterium leiognathi]|uniref:BCCT family transporter n=1 Tax=Photobacterium leiognathi TaxID=553611 RepID=UPI002982958E|nr:BCCT family transporter [Photobacterium leiognathi]